MPGNPDSSIVGTPGTAGDRFGAAVVLTDLNGDSVAELLVGAPGEDVTGRGKDAGVVIAIGGAKSATQGRPGPGSNVLTGPGPSAAYGWSLYEFCEVYKCGCKGH